MIIVLVTNRRVSFSEILGSLACRRVATLVSPGSYALRLVWAKACPVHRFLESVGVLVTWVSRCKAPSAVMDSLGRLNCANSSVILVIRVCMHPCSLPSRCGPGGLLGN